MTIENQKYKDTVFRKLFHDKERLLELYNGVNHSNYDNPDDLEITTLEGNTFLNMKNDLSFIIDYELSLYEHQSTPCPNIPLRNLEYVASIYREIIPIEETYKTKKIDIPTPRFITFYNGAVKMEDEKIYKLSDLYHKSTDNPELELIVKVININEGHNKELMDDCKTLKEYSIFVAKVRKCIKEEKSNVKAAITRAVDECINEDILKDFLLENREEVIEMGVLGYNAEKHLQVIQDESFDTVFDLYEWLFDNDRVSDAKRASKDREFRKQLLEEYASASKNE